VSTHSLLFIDDEPNILESLGRVFRKENYDVRFASSASDGWTAISRQPADLIICDQSMPGLTGGEFLARVKQDYPDTVRIILTGHADAEVAIAAINEGQVHRFLTKPWRNEELKLIIRETLYQRDLVLENRRLHKLVLSQNEQLIELNTSLEEKVQERTLEISRKNEELACLYSELDQSFDDSIRVFAGLIELRDTFIGSHSKRVGEASRAVAESMGLDGEAIREVERAAVLHDIGKIGIPQHILKGDHAALTKEERIILQRHTVLGQAAVQVIDNLQGVGLIIRHHHERYDGKGYPDGLQGNDIPLGARIIAVTDTYDYFMYRQRDGGAPSEESAVQAIEYGSSRAFDPGIVTAFLQLRGSWRFNAKEPLEIRVAVKELSPGMVLSRDLYTTGGLLLAPKNTALKQSYIDRIGNYHKVDPIKGGVYVLKTSPAPSS